MEYRASYRCVLLACPPSSLTLVTDHTRITTIAPTISFSATISLSSAPTPQSQPQNEGDEYLTPGVPVASQNLLAAIAQSSIFADSPNPPYVPASRLHKSPLRVPRQRTLQLRSQIPTVKAVSPQFKLQPAVLSRLRTFHLSTAPSLSKVLANVEVEVAQDVGEAEIEGLDIAPEEGQIDLHGQQQARIVFPKTLKKGDVMSLAYIMSPDNGSAFLDHSRPQSTKSRAKITLTATVTTDQNSTSAPIKIQSHWFASIDFARTSRPSVPAPSTTDTASELDHLITLTTTRQNPYPTPPTAGTTFRWHVLLANRSTTRTLNLAIIPITPTANPITPRDWSATLTSAGSDSAAGNLRVTQKADGTVEQQQQRQGTWRAPSQVDSYTQLPMWLYASAAAHTHAGSRAGSAGAPATQSQAHASAHNQAPSPIDFNTIIDSEVTHLRMTPSLLTTTPDIRPGPLPPGASTAVEVEFMVLGGAGNGGVEALRVVDLDSAEREGRWRWVDVAGGMLPGVFVVGEREDDGEQNNEVGGVRGFEDESGAEVVEVA